MATISTSPTTASTPHHHSLSSPPSLANNVDYTIRPLPDSNIHLAGKCTCVAPDNTPLGLFRRRLSIQSQLYRPAAPPSPPPETHILHQPSPAISLTSPDVMQPLHRTESSDSSSDERNVDRLRSQLDRTLSPNSLAAHGVAHSHFAPPKKSSAASVARAASSSFSSSSPSNLSNPSNSSNVMASQQTPPKINAPNASSTSSNTSHPRLPGGSLAAAMNGTLPDPSSFASQAMNDTPATTAPSSPRIFGNAGNPAADVGAGTAFLPAPVRQNSGTSTPRLRATTLDIPGLTKSKVSPDGRIAQEDLGAKLVIVMVGLPARGKSYITKKLARYLNWLQHDTRIFNVGERRRTVAGGPNSAEKGRGSVSRSSKAQLPPPTAGTPLNQESTPAESVVEEAVADAPHAAELSDDMERHIQPPVRRKSLATVVLAKDADEREEDSMEQNAGFFDPQNKKASLIREQVARETLDELLNYILNENGSIGILDATNSTAARRKMIMERVRERAGPQLNVLFLESRCVDQELLEANMRLKLNGPDYKEMDPTIALEDFKKRVREYEKAYVPLGEYEERNNMPYIQMIDVGRKVISHQIKGFLMAQANYYLLNFNLAPRQIWITRHGLSTDNVSGRIGGDSDLAPEGYEYAQSLTRFMGEKRREWDLRQIDTLKNTHFPPQPGDSTPPNPYFHPPSPGAIASDASSVVTDGTDIGYQPKAFCVWTSMLKRSIQTAAYFNDEEYDTKQMRMLDELNAGVMEGLTYNCISEQYPEEYRSRKVDKLHYRYPGPGGEGYLDIINRLRPVIVELERMTDHVLLVGHRSVSRVLLAYFRGLDREAVADLDVPLGMLYCLEPKPYGVDFKAYRWDKAMRWFYEVPNFQLKRAEDDML